jgi:hypothetical protein
MTSALQYLFMVALCCSTGCSPCKQLVAHPERAMQAPSLAIVRDLAYGTDAVRGGIRQPAGGSAGDQRTGPPGAGCSEWWWRRQRCK